MSSLRAAGLIVFRILSNDIEYLMLQTSYGHHHWTPPKGHVDPGENDMETALRETREEAGLEGHHLQVLEDCRTELHYEVRGKPKTVVYWLAKLLDPQTTAVRLSDEHRDFKWGNLEESCRLITDYPDLQAALRQCQTFLLSASNNP